MEIGILQEGQMICYLLPVRRKIIHKGLHMV